MSTLLLQRRIVPALAIYRLRSWRRLGRGGGQWGRECLFNHGQLDVHKSSVPGAESYVPYHQNRPEAIPIPAANCLLALAQSSSPLPAPCKSSVIGLCAYRLRRRRLARRCVSIAVEKGQSEVVMRVKPRGLHTLTIGLILVGTLAILTAVGIILFMGRRVANRRVMELKSTRSLFGKSSVHGPCELSRAQSMPSLFSNICRAATTKLLQYGIVDQNETRTYGRFKRATNQEATYWISKEFQTPPTGRIAGPCPPPGFRSRRTAARQEHVRRFAPHRLQRRQE